MHTLMEPTLSTLKTLVATPRCHPEGSRGRTFPRVPFLRTRRDAVEGSPSLSFLSHVLKATPSFHARGSELHPRHKGDGLFGPSGPEGTLTRVRCGMRSLAATLALVLLAAAVAAAGTVTGVVHNGTNNKPAAGVDIILIQLQGGMQPVANTKTDAQGNYKIDNAAIGQGPMLIRAVYHGVMFHQPLVPGTSNVDVTVYDPTADPKTIKVDSRLIVFQPDGPNLVVGEEYTLQNQSQPPLAYFNEKGDFTFDAPTGVDLSQVSSWGPSKMPVVQSTINKGPGKYAIAYAFQPGENGVRMSYQIPYSSNAATLKFTSDYSADHVMLVAPPSVQVTSAGFMPAGTEQGFNLYTRDAVSAGTNFQVAVSGTAPPPQQGGADQGQGQPDAQAQDPVNGRDTGVTIQTMPDRLDSLRWILVVGFAGLFGLGIAFVWRRPVAVMAPVAASDEPTAPSGGPRRNRKQAQAAARQAAPPVAAPVQAQVAPPATNGGAATVATVERDVELSLDGLKDRLFRLELRRQAGTITEEEYVRERNRTEEVLRELVRG